MNCKSPSHWENMLYFGECGRCKRVWALGEDAIKINPVPFSQFRRAGIVAMKAAFAGETIITTTNPSPSMAF